MMDGRRGTGDAAFRAQPRSQAGRSGLAMRKPRVRRSAATAQELRDGEARMSDRDPSPIVRHEAGPAPDPFVPASEYFSRDFAEQEIAKVWPRVWQMVCREEDIPNVGDFHTYEIVDDSIVVIRSGQDEIKAFHNVCPHRGRRLAEGCGHSARLHCRFHGWQFDLHGRNLVVVDRDDWEGALDDDDLALKPVKVARWGGWIYINMDPDSESFEE